MDNSHPGHGLNSEAAGWDERHRGRPAGAWSAGPNGALIAETSDLAPGRAVDIGCGEGGDAIWLASRGWHVTGVDISQVALERAATNAAKRGVSVDWVCADIVADPPTPGVYDLVSAHYPALLRSADDAVIEALLIGVAPGGTLLVVHHGDVDPEYARSYGFNPGDYVQPADVVERLDVNWTIQVNETRPRQPISSGGSSPHSKDTVLKARRST